MHMYVLCAQAKKRIVHTLHTYGETDTGDYGGLSPWGAIPRCSTAVTMHCFRPLRPRERRGYCLDFFAVIAMTAIHDEDSLDMVCDARRIKSVDAVIPLLSDEIKSLCVFPDGKNLSQAIQNIYPLHYFKLDFPHILFVSFLYVILYMYRKIGNAFG